MSRLRNPGIVAKSETPGTRLPWCKSIPLVTSYVTNLGQVDLCASVSSSQTEEQSVRNTKKLNEDQVAMCANFFN